MAPGLAFALSFTLFSAVGAIEKSKAGTAATANFRGAIAGAALAQGAQDQSLGAAYGHPGWLSSCRAIYLDVGANMGVQVRKLFEPEKYPGAAILDEFDRVYGAASVRQAPAATSGICALGLEPNPEHMPRLQEIEKAYKRRGWRVHFYPFAAWSGEGQMGFNMTGKRDNAEDGTELDAHLEYRKKGRETLQPAASDYMVRTVDLADFVASLPTHTVKIMKMDIEGAEYETLASMLRQATLCGDRIEEALIEVHAWGEIDAWVSDAGAEPMGPGVHPRSFTAIERRMSGFLTSGACDSEVTKVLELDDESYSQDVDTSFGADGKASEGPHSLLSAVQLGVPSAHGRVSAQIAEMHSYSHPGWLSSCSSIFLDVGSNIGVQVRKLFEPELYPDASITNEFDKSFGPPIERQASGKSSGLCALGLEPNPEHLPRLRQIERAYKRRGWRVHFYPFAAWNAEGQLGFNMTGRRDNAEAGENLDAHLDARSGDGAVAASDYTVRTVDLADFVSTLPPKAVKIMKMDIEGAEYETLASMLRGSTLCASHAERAFIEVHPWGEITRWKQSAEGIPALGEGVHPRSFQAIQDRMAALAASGFCDGPTTDISELDDETYSQDVDSNFEHVASEAIPTSAQLL